ncbi:16S rRNA (uracil(1498)-N(3))-methyltransferase [Candidatus Pacebacteria bacterium]|nr:16S rRNA (uracil(1498)-N(3))-methyltransferase [Candidatus Paceibacterota bacterium]
MKKHRFFVRQEINPKSSEVALSDPSVAHQMRHVLRLRKEDEVILLDGTGREFHGQIKILTKGQAVISKLVMKEKSKNNEINEIKMNLFVSLIKKDKFEWVLQKATELGVSRITPIISDRTEKQKINMDRADKIVLEASEQSGRTEYPFIDEPISLKEALSICETTPIVLDLEGETIDVTQLRETHSTGSGQAGEISVFVGPEGGWSKKDFEQFEKKEYKRVTLGHQVLRAETASVAVCSLLLLG